MRGARRGLLERPRPAVVVERQRLAVEDEPRRPGSARATVDHLGQPGGDVVEASGWRRRTSSPSRCTWIRMPSSLVSTATGAAAGLGHRGGDVGRAGGEHRQHRPADLEPELGQRLLAAGQRGDRRPATVEPASIAARRTAASGTPAGGGHRLLDQRVEGALADVAGDHAAQPGLLVGGGPAEQLGDRGRPGRLRARRRRAPRSRRTPSCTSSTVSVGSSAGVGQRAEAAPAQAGAPLAQRAAEVGRRPSRSPRARPRRSSSASAATLALRERVAATAAEVATTSASSTRPFCPPPPTSADDPRVG